MQRKPRSSRNLIITVLVLLTMTTACAPSMNSAPAGIPVDMTSTPLILTPEPDTATASAIPATDTPSQVAEWPVYTLAAELPDAPTQMSLYRQVVPAGLPDEKRLAEIMEQLHMTGAVSTSTSEAGETVLTVTGDSGSFSLVSDDPFLLGIENAPHMLESDSPAVVLPADVRIQAAEEFLSARGLLDFPYLIEPPRMSRDRDHAIRIVQLIDGFPLYDYDPLNGRLLVWFNPAGEISVVFWRPLKLTASEDVSIVPADVAWEQFVNGELPEGEGLGQCWQAAIFDPHEPTGLATPLHSPPCGSSAHDPSHSYQGATIQEITLVYFASDLSVGMSPFAFPADSPARIVFPMWQFYGSTDDGRELTVLWPAVQAP